MVNLLNNWDTIYEYYLMALNYRSLNKITELNNIQNIIDRQMNNNEDMDELEDIELKQINIDTSYKIPYTPNKNIDTYNEDKQKRDKYMKKRCQSNIFDYLYSIFIISIISWKLVFILTYTIYNKDIMFLLRNLYDCGIPFQYYFGKKYFLTNHFEEIINKAKIFYPNRYFNYINIYSIILIILSIIFSIMEICILLTSDNEINTSIYTIVYNYKTKYTASYIIILFFIGNIYSFNIFFSNVFTFSIIFRILSMDIKNFYNEIKNNKNKYLPSELCNSLIRLRNEYETAIDKLNLIFSTNLFFGGVATYIVLIDIHEKLVTPFQLIYAIIFLILLSIYLKSILVTKQVQRNLQNYSYSNEMIEKLLSRKQILEINNNQKSKFNFYNNNLDLRSVILDSENAETLDWLITYQVFNDEWDTFILFGFPLDDLNFFKKALFLLISYYAVGKFSIIFKLFE